MNETKDEILKIEGLSKRYSKKGEWAIADISLSCYAGEIVGLLGHNGAGKSTTLKCLEGMIPFEEGQILICGHDVRKEPIEAKSNMGFVTDNHAAFLKMTGIQFINFYADIYRVPAELREQRLKELEEIFCLGNSIQNLISSYSHGMRQKVCMMASLIHRPRLWVLDEPMTGLDPRTQDAVLKFMHSYVAEGNTILFSSHTLGVVAKLCDRIFLLRKGQQIDSINVKEKYAADPNFDFEEYFFKYEG